MKIEASDRDLASILAGLRLLQQLRDREIGSGVLTIATDGGSFERLDYEEIDTLCERLNTEALCQRCNSPLKEDRCTDETCPFSDYAQSDSRGWSGHPDADTLAENPARTELAQLEAEFEAAGGRGVELADRIDALREELGEDLQGKE